MHLSRLLSRSTLRCAAVRRPLLTAPTPILFKSLPGAGAKALTASQRAAVGAEKRAKSKALQEKMDGLDDIEDLYDELESSGRPNADSNVDHSVFDEDGFRNTLRSIMSDANVRLNRYVTAVRPSADFIETLPVEGLKDGNTARLVREVAEVEEVSPGVLRLTAAERYNLGRVLVAINASSAAITSRLEGEALVVEFVRPSRETFERIEKAITALKKEVTTAFLAERRAVETKLQNTPGDRASLSMFVADAAVIHDDLLAKFNDGVKQALVKVKGEEQESYV